MDAIVVNWHKKPGDQVIRDEILVEIETDKVVLEIPAVDSGVLESIVKKEGAIVLSKELLGYIIANDKVEKTTNIKNIIPPKYNDDINLEKENDNTLTPAVRRLIAKHELNPSNIKGSGIKDRIIPDDVNKHIKDKKNKNILTEQKDNTNIKVSSSVSNRNEKSIPMTPLRRRIAERLLKAKNNAAILTTFNEVNMKPILDLRKQYGESFENRHGIRLGLMSFYVKATVEALKRYPEVNASINDLNIIYHNYFDISIAISTPRGLVTPVLRNVDLMSMAEIEKKIKEFSIKGRDGKLTIDELTGGNFTITNGGVFGSLMSTPIINPPQSGILGMHIIKDRAMVVDGVVKILPMMYLALSYDHRLIDGRESVSFLITIKNMLEDPARLLLDV
ncbi:2-oxoglutarate dehydrogenase complex dihydrolipoyllysine-residue succinyltransferase [Arsenophonus endosymbiont of Lipoptena cervi]